MVQSLEGQLPTLDTPPQETSIELRALRSINHETDTGFFNEWIHDEPSSDR